MADWDGLRDSLEHSVTPPPLDALRTRLRRRERRRVATVSSALALVVLGSGVAVVNRHTAHTPPVAAGTRIDRFALGDKLPPPRDYAAYVVTDVDFVGPGLGWAIGLRCVGDACDVATWRTSDGGQSWEAPVTVAAGVPRQSFADQDPRGGGARSLRMVDAREGFAFNPDLYLTHDGGAHWTRAPQPTKVAGLQVQGHTWWAFERGCGVDDSCDPVLRGGVLGAARATVLPLPSTGRGAAVVRRQTRDVAYLVSWDPPDGSGAALRRTGDGGRTWADAVNPCRNAEAEVVSVRAGLWLACATGGGVQLYRSTAGTDWRRLPDPPVSGTLTDLVAVSDTVAYVTAQQPAALLVTRDGGRTWAPAPGAGRGGYGYANLDAPDPAHVWAMGDAGILWRTTDGATWERLALPPGAPRATPGVPAPADLGVKWTGVSFIDAYRGWAVGRRCTDDICHAVVRRTTDGGQTWTVTGAPRLDVSALAFADERTGYAYDPALAVTHDGGATWADLHGTHVRDVQVRAGYAWVLAYQGCAGSDCGAYVSRLRVGAEQPPSGAVLMGGPGHTRTVLAAADADHAFLYGYEGTTGQLLGTDDGGRTWTGRTQPCGGAPPSALGAVTGQVWAGCGYVAGDPSARSWAHSTDGGTTWTPVPAAAGRGAAGTLVALSATDAWRAGDGGVVVRTADGGHNWVATHVPVVGTAALLAFQLLDVRTGVALYGGDVFLRTTDGRTWSRMTRP